MPKASKLSSATVLNLDAATDGRFAVPAGEYRVAQALYREERYVACAAHLIRHRRAVAATAAGGAPPCKDGRTMLRDALAGVVARPGKTLGVGPGADAAAIARAYRGLALAHHPDKTPGSTALFAALATARDVLLASAPAGVATAAAAKAAPPRKTPPPPPPVAAAAAAKAHWDGKEGPVTTTRLMFDGGDEDVGWERNFWAFAAYRTKRRDGDPPPKSPLGRWCAAQRVAHEAGKLPAARRARLTAVGLNVEDGDWRRAVERVDRRAPPRTTGAASPTPGATAAPTADDDDACMPSCSSGGGEGRGVSWLCTRPAVDAAPRVEAKTWELKAFGYVLLRLDRVASYAESPVRSPD